MNQCDDALRDGFTLPTSIGGCDSYPYAAYGITVRNIGENFFFIPTIFFE